MQTIPKGRPVPVIRRSVIEPQGSNTPSRDMGQTVLPDNPRNVDDSNKAAHNMHNSYIKAAIKTPEEERRRYQQRASPAPNAYHGARFSPKPSPVVRPQSAMALTSPTGGNNNNNNNAGNFLNNYNNTYGKAVIHQRPPSSLGIRDVPRSQHDKPPIMHQHSRSFGDGITAEQVFTDRLPPRDVPTDAYHRRNQSADQNKSPLPPRGNPSGPRGSYNPYYASNLDYNSRTGAGEPHPHADKTPHENPPYSSTQDPGARTKSSTPAAASQDLRSAWQRLYGQNAEASGRRPSVDHLTHNHINHNPPPYNRAADGDFQRSPRQATRSPFPGAEVNNNMHGQSVRMIPRGKQVAGPMVAPPFHLNTGRQTPPGQCSNSPNPNPNPKPQGFINSPTEQPNSFSSPKPAIKNFRSTPTPHQEQQHNLGPAAKYPDNPDTRTRKTTTFDDQLIHIQTQSTADAFNNVNSKEQQGQQYARKDFGGSGSRESGGLFRQSSNRFTHNDAYCSDTEIDAEDEQDILPTDSIFDYLKSDSDEEHQPAAAGHQQVNPSRQELLHHHNLDLPSFPRNETLSSNVVNVKDAAKAGDRRPSELNAAQYARSRSLEDVRESGDDVSNVSFDIENTFLMVDPSDQSEMGTLRSKNSDVKTKLNRLEGMYAKVMKTLETRSPKESRGRRWSIGSSDTNSIRHQVHQHSKHGRTNNQRMSNREIKSVNKRFQRLESHVITLARSIAHISSELRTQTTMSREIENVKREIQELKISSNNGNGEKERKRHDFDKYRGYNHPLTNPKQVNKLTRFFGQEPSWLEIFLTRLGYEQYVKNFHQEHIGMMELPYMTDDQLKSIGIPMGPRTRILQESQMCFKDDNFNIYIV